MSLSGADPGFQVRGGGAFKKIAPSGRRREHFWGISCEKSRFYAKKSYINIKNFIFIYILFLSWYVVYKYVIIRGGSRISS